MGTFIAIGLLAFITGLFLLISPGTLGWINEKTKIVVTSLDRVAFDYRVGFGIFFIIASLLFFFVAYYIRIRG